MNQNEIEPLSKLLTDQTLGKRLVKQLAELENDPDPEKLRSTCELLLQMVDYDGSCLSLEVSLLLQLHQEAKEALCLVDALSAITKLLLVINRSLWTLVVALEDQGEEILDDGGAIHEISKNLRKSIEYLSDKKGPSVDYAW